MILYAHSAEGVPGAYGSFSGPVVNKLLSTHVNSTEKKLHTILLVSTLVRGRGHVFRSFSTDNEKETRVQQAVPFSPQPFSRSAGCGRRDTKVRLY